MLYRTGKASHKTPACHANIDVAAVWLSETKDPRMPLTRCWAVVETKRFDMVSAQPGVAAIILRGAQAAVADVICETCIPRVNQAHVLSHHAAHSSTQASCLFRCKYHSAVCVYAY